MPNGKEKQKLINKPNKNNRHPQRISATRKGYPPVNKTLNYPKKHFKKTFLKNSKSTKHMKPTVIIGDEITDDEKIIFIKKTISLGGIIEVSNQTQ